MVLAPFNSTFGSFESFGSEVWKNLYFKGDVLKLHHRVKEIDRQYEYNNNCELDNGVYNKFMVENMNKQAETKEAVKQEDFEEGPELKALEVMIQQ